MIGQTLPDQRVIGFGYDGNGNLTSVTPPSRPQHGFTFTPVDLEASYTPPAVTPGGATQYSYNKDRRLTQVTRPDGKTIQIAYDTAGRSSGVTIGRGSYGFTYDPTTGMPATEAAPNGEAIANSFDGPLLTEQAWSGTVTGAGEKARLRKEWELLLTVWGIGKILGLTIMYEAGDVGRFPGAGHFASYCRCVDAQRLSNGKKKANNNAKNGNKYLAWAFVEAAHYAVRFYPEAKRFYDRKTAKTNGVVAIKAIAHKLARAAFHVLRDQQPFDPKRVFV